MYSKVSTPTGKSTKGSVSIINSNGRLQLRFRYGGQRHYLSLGFADTPTNRKRAEMKAREIELDIVSGHFDSTLERYKVETTLKTPEKPVTPITPKLADLWERFTQYQANHLEETTIVRDYGEISRRIGKLKHEYLGDAAAIRDELLKLYSPEITRRTIRAFSQCCEWAIVSNLINHNPFLPLLKNLKRVSGQKKTRKCFTPEERDLIIQAFENNTYCPKTSAFKHSYYTNMVKFAFYSGCRPQDVVALKWKHIKKGFISFTEAYSCRLRVTKSGKTKTSRLFPINAQMQAVLDDVASKLEGKPDPDSYIFPSPSGKPVNNDNFNRRYWNTIVNGLLNDGKISQHLPFNNSRHSFITMALEAGLDAKDVAPLVGNSAKTIYDHYAAQKREITIPEL